MSFDLSILFFKKNIKKPTKPEISDPAGLYFAEAYTALLTYMSSASSDYAVIRSSSGLSSALFYESPLTVRSCSAS